MKNILTYFILLCLALPLAIKAQEHCIKFPAKKRDIILNPSFEIAASNCASNYVFPNSGMLIGNWTNLHYIVPVGYVNKCSNFAITAGQLAQDKVYAQPLIPNTYDANIDITFAPLMPQPIPDGNSALLITDGANPLRGGLIDSGQGKSYAASCLVQPLKKDSLYRLDFSLGFGYQSENTITYRDTTTSVILGAGDTLFGRGFDNTYGKVNNGVSSSRETITLWGKTECGNYLAYRNYHSCLANQGWVELGSVTINSEPGNWVKASIPFVARQDISAIAIGPGCEIQKRVDSAYFYQFFIDDLQMYSPTLERPYITQIAGSMCNRRATLQLNPRGIYKSSDVQWFKNNRPVASANNDTIVIGINEQGYYQCRVQNDSVCLFTDSMGVFWQTIPPASFLGNDTTVCYTDSITLNADAGFGASYLWQNGSTKPTLTVSSPGTYRVTITNACGPATIEKRVSFTTCLDSLFIPTAFTPNGDGKNDVFKPFYYYTGGHYNIAIYNRYGQQLFTSNSSSEGWDGTYKGIQQPAGAYIYQINYRRRNGKAYFAKGMVVLIR